MSNDANIFSVSDEPAPSAVKRPTSLKELARHVGLSSAAVSRVLNGTPEARSIPKGTQERIFAAAKELDYRPNVFARSLRNRRSQTIGILVPEVSEGYTTLVLSGIEQHLREAGYFYFLASHGHSTELIARGRRLLLERAVEGIVAIDTLLEGECSVPTVSVSGEQDLAGMTRISLNHERAAELALEHLTGLGHLRIAFIRGQSFSSDTLSRWGAIEAAAERLGVAIDTRLTADLSDEDLSHGAGYQATKELLASGEGFTALFAFNDVSAIGAVRGLREAGLRVPEDVSVVGFDDVQSAAYQNPGLTTVRQPLRDMGVLAAATLLEQIARGPAGLTSSRGIVVDPVLVVRGSTAPVSGAAAEHLRPPTDEAQTETAEEVAVGA